MKLNQCKGWKAVHFEDRAILRTDRNLYPEAHWWALISKVEVEPMETKGHYRVIDERKQNMMSSENNTYRYYDKNGTEITEGSFIKYPDGTVKEVYRTVDGELGTDATNPAWIASGRAEPCEYGIYPLTTDDTDTVEVVERRLT